MSSKAQLVPFFNDSGMSQPETELQFPGAETLPTELSGPVSVLCSIVQYLIETELPVTRHCHDETSKELQLTKFQASS